MGLVGLSFYSIFQLSCRTCNIYCMKQLLAGHLTVCRTLTGTRDPAPLFINPDVQKLLRKLTRIDLKKVYRQRRNSQKLEPPEYKFMTSEELNKCVADASARAGERLQIPPVVKPREEVQEVLSQEPALAGYDEAKFIFTDITFGVSDKGRLIVVRDENGELRKASWEQRFRMNQIYFPHAGRKLKIPRMFEEEYLKRLLDKEEYEFVLDRACVQFEPDDPNYHSVTSAVFAHIESGRKFETLESTRHFGALVFYLAWNKCIDSLLLQYIHNDRMADAVAIIQLFHIVNPEAKSAKVEHNSQHVPFIQAYVELDSSKKSALELALQSHLELAKQRKEVQEGIQRAHGHPAEART